MEKKLKVTAINNGTVIDRIPSKVLFKVISILGLDSCDTMFSFGNNLPSKKIGKKGIIKIENRFFKDSELNKIALVAPEAQVNIINDFEVIEKRYTQLPEEVLGLVKCFNPKCITNNEEMTTSFTVASKSPVQLRCKYCEKITREEDIRYR